MNKTNESLEAVTHTHTHTHTMLIYLKQIRNIT